MASSKSLGVSRVPESDDAGAIWLPTFKPRRFLANGHLQTVVGNYLPRANRLPLPERTLVEVEAASAGKPASRVLCDCHWQPEQVRGERLTVVLVHGLEGSSNSQYIIGNANKLWHAGCNIVRMNMRNCGIWDGAAARSEPDETNEAGGTAGDMAALSPTLYHSGMSGDVLAVASHFIRTYGLQALALVGYSMGGNLVLKLTGEVTQVSFPQLKAVVGVSPAIDLGPSADALHLPVNRLYEWKFLHAMKKRFRRKARLFPWRYSTARLMGIRTLREFDDRITAFYEGFDGADDYYFRVSAARTIDRIAVPALVLHALDDPFVRLTQDTRCRLLANPLIALVETRNGGHCAFLAARGADLNDDGYWAEETLRSFLLTNLERNNRPASLWHGAEPGASALEEPAGSALAATDGSALAIPDAPELTGTGGRRTHV